MTSEIKEWMELQKLARKAQLMNLRHEFSSNQNRSHCLSLSIDNKIFFDFSRQLVNTEIMKGLYALAKAGNIKEKIQEMFSGQKINSTENRAVLHVALRNFSNIPIKVDEIDVMPQVKSVLAKIKKFSLKIHKKQLTGTTGDPLKNIVAIGIGGSYLGPEFIAEANRVYAKPGMKLRFIR